MNWKRLYNRTTEHERQQAAALMLEYIAARHSRRVFVRGKWMLERRRRHIAHYINNRRQPLTRERIIRLVNFAFILYTVTAAVLAVAFHAPLQLALPMLALYTMYLWYLFLAPIVRTVKQYSR